MLRFSPSAIERHARLSRGTTVPDVGTIASVRPPVYWKYVVGRYNRRSPVFIVRTSEGGRYKMVTDLRPKPQTGTLPRIPALVQRLHSYPFEGFVPQIRYASDEQILVDFVSGATLETVEMNTARAARLGEFNGSCRFRPAEGDGSPEPSATLQSLRRRYDRCDNALLSAGGFERVEQAFQRLETCLPECPKVVTCVDASLKNYVERPDGAIVYIDLFGIRTASAGITCVRQLFEVPSALRRAYLESFLAHAFDAEHLREYLADYCIVYLAGRLPRSARRRRLSALRGKRVRDKKAPFVRRLQAAVDGLPPQATIQTLFEWLETVE